MKIYRLLLSVSLLLTLSSFTLEKPETADLDPETKGIAKDIKSIKAEEQAINTLESRGGKAMRYVQKQTQDAIKSIKDRFQGLSQEDIDKLEKSAAQLKGQAEHIKSTLRSNQSELKSKFNAIVNKLSHELNQIGK